MSARLFLLSALVTTMLATTAGATPTKSDAARVTRSLDEQEAYIYHGRMVTALTKMRERSARSRVRKAAWSASDSDACVVSLTGATRRVSIEAHELKKVTLGKDGGLRVRRHLQVRACLRPKQWGVAKSRAPSMTIQHEERHGACTGLPGASRLQDGVLRQSQGMRPRAKKLSDPTLRFIMAPIGTYHARR